MAVKDSKPIIDGEITDTAASMRTYLGQHRGHVALVLLGTLAIEVLIYLIGTPAGLFYILPFLWPVLEYSSISSKIQDEFLQQFAKANGFTFSDTGPIPENGRLFQIGHDRYVSDLIVGTESDRPIQFYTYSYEVGQGKQKESFSFTVFGIAFDVDVPDMLLLSREHRIGKTPDLDGLKVVELEGDFSKSFTLYVKDGYEIEALEIFTPDVMAEILDKGLWYSLEISQNDLYLCVGYRMESKKDLDAMQSFAHYFLDNVGPVLAQMKPGLLATEAEKRGE